MTSTLPVRPDLEHLRREAKQLLRKARTGEYGAVARMRNHAVGLPIALRPLSWSSPGSSASTPGASSSRL